MVEHNINSPIEIYNLFDYIKELGINIEKSPYSDYKIMLLDDLKNGFPLERNLNPLLSTIPQDKKIQIKNFIEGKI